MTALIVIDKAHAELSNLPARIDAAVRDAEQHAWSAVDAALCAGRLLAEAKALVPHGEWESWLGQNCAVALRTAQAYMRLHKRVASLPMPEAQRVADLPLREAIAAISTPPVVPTREPRYRPQDADIGRSRPIFQTASRAVASMVRDIGVRPVKRDRIKLLREKLAATLAELDRMLGEVQS